MFRGIVQLFDEGKRRNARHAFLLLVVEFLNSKSSAGISTCEVILYRMRTLEGAKWWGGGECIIGVINVCR